ncbi:jg20461, partial [Pararge aegeria aegeria]
FLCTSASVVTCIVARNAHYTLAQHSARGEDINAHATPHSLRVARPRKYWYYLLKNRSRKSKSACNDCDYFNDLIRLRRKPADRSLCLEQYRDAIISSAADGASAIDAFEGGHVVPMLLFSRTD